MQRLRALPPFLRSRYKGGRARLEDAGPPESSQTKWHARQHGRLSLSREPVVPRWAVGKRAVGKRAGSCCHGGCERGRWACWSRQRHESDGWMNEC